MMSLPLLLLGAGAAAVVAVVAQSAAPKPTKPSLLIGSAHLIKVLGAPGSPASVISDQELSHLAAQVYWQTFGTPISLMWNGAATADAKMLLAISKGVAPPANARAKIFDVLWSYVALGAGLSVHGPPPLTPQAVIAMALAWELDPARASGRVDRLIARARQVIASPPCYGVLAPWLTKGSGPFQKRTFGSMLIWTVQSQKVCEARKALWTHQLNTLLASNTGPRARASAEFETLLVGFISAVALFKAQLTDYGRSDPGLVIDFAAVFGAIAAAIAAVAGTIATAGAAAVAAGVVTGVTAAVATSAAGVAGGVAAGATTASLAAEAAQEVL